MTEKIDKIISNWDPIGIGYPFSETEYKQYTNEISRLINNKEELRLYLIEVLIKLGLDYNPEDKNQNDDIDNVVTNLLSIEK